jgi:hypothetical protein
VRAPRLQCETRFDHRDGHDPVIMDAAEVALGNGCGTGQRRHTNDSGNSEKTFGSILNGTAFCTFLSRCHILVGLASRLRGGATFAAILAFIVVQQSLHG